MALVPDKRLKKSATAASSSPLKFPDGKPKFSNNELKATYAELKDSKVVIPTPTPDIDTMRKLGIYDEVRGYLTSCGLGILLSGDEFHTYEVPTREFVVSFDTYDDNGERGWKFQLGNRTFKRSYEYLLELFGFPSDGVLKEYSAEEKDAFWLEISDMPYFCPLMAHSNIKSGVWKYIHRIIASGFNTRKDGDRFVNGFDMKYMMMIRENVPVEWLRSLEGMFEEWQNKDGANVAIGGGYFVTLIAKSLGFDMSTAGDALVKVLDTKQLVVMKDLKSDRRTWNHDPNVHDRVKRTIEARLNAGAKKGKKGKGKRAAEPENQEEEIHPEHFHAPEPDFTTPARPSIEQQLIMLGDRMTTLEVDHAVFSGRTNNILTRMEDKLDWLIERSPGHDASAPHPRSYYGSSSGHRDE